MKAYPAVEPADKPPKAGMKDNFMGRENE